MTCPVCNMPQFAQAHFCRQCGTRLAPVAAYAGPYAPQPALRVQQNQQALGIAWMIYGAFYLLTTLVATVALHSFLAHGMFGDVPPFARALAGTFLPLVGLLCVAMSGLAVLAGYGVMKARPWARTLAIVLAIFALLKFPVGTALGIYTLWVLASRQSCAEWQLLQQEG